MYIYQIKQFVLLSYVFIVIFFKKYHINAEVTWPWLWPWSLFFEEASTSMQNLKNIDQQKLWEIPTIYVIEWKTLLKINLLNKFNFS